MKAIMIFLATCFFFACTQQQPVDNRASRNKERIQQFYDQLVNAHNAEMVDSFFTADVKDHMDELSEPIVGADSMKSGFREFFATFPDAHLQTHFMVAEGDTVVAKVTMTGTNTGPLRGGPPTGKAINVSGTAVFVLKDGKINERWRNFDDVAMMQQLGMMGRKEAEDSAQAR